MSLDVRDHLPGVALEPTPIEVLGRGPELHNEVTGEVVRFDLAPLLTPEVQEDSLMKSR